MGDVRHNCSISVTRTLEDAYGFLKSQDHRGPDASGIGALRSDGLVDVVKWTGPVGVFDIEGLQELFPDEYSFFFSHGRYATRGSDVPLLDEAHPITIGGEHYPDHVQKGGVHRIVRGARAAIIHNGQVPDLGYEDLETRVDSEQLLRYYLEHGPERTMLDVTLAYTAVFADKSGLKVMRDRTGIKPGVLGVKNRQTVIASEDVAIRKNHARVVENLKPGTIYELHADGTHTKTFVVRPHPKRCFFEWM
jgi:glutamine phosphoribosylpyrophosphate amidotransferase